ncbi:MAG: hypothetical protein HQM14_16250 [SAR324 cluster bacterium]|nr:hypothetical protein [SAR324 cluster bacterium]
MNENGFNTEAVLFDPQQYDDLTKKQRILLKEAYDRALEVLKKNITPLGFSACSIDDNISTGTDANYHSVWARDGAATVIWSLDIREEAIFKCQKQTLRTLLDHQAPSGQIPANVGVATNKPDYGGVGGIGSIDSALWLVIALWRFTKDTGDQSLIQDYYENIQKMMLWLGAQDINNCGMLEVPDCSDWMDLFTRNYNVLYDEVLWYRVLLCYSNILELCDEKESALEYQKKAAHVGKVILENFWPSTVNERQSRAKDFSERQFFLGNSQYLISQISPFSFSWRCDVYANVLAYLNGLTNKEHAQTTFNFLWGVGINSPWPVKNIYPPVAAGDPEWADFFTVNLLNLPNHYHNGGIWPFIGALWVRFIHKLGMKNLARRELVRVAQLCKGGVSDSWEFNEWAHAVTGRPMGKRYQAWNAASFIRACHDLHVEPESLKEGF